MNYYSNTLYTCHVQIYSNLYYFLLFKSCLKIILCNFIIQYIEIDYIMFINHFSTYEMLILNSIKMKVF